MPYIDKGNAYILLQWFYKNPRKAVVFGKKINISNIGDELKSWSTLDPELPVSFTYYIQLGLVLLWVKKEMWR